MNDLLMIEESKTYEKTVLPPEVATPPLAASLTGR